MFSARAFARGTVALIGGFLCMLGGIGSPEPLAVGLYALGNAVLLVAVLAT